MGVDVAGDARVTATRTPTADTPALVLGSGITALGVVRCLGRAGIPLFCAAEELESVAYSRWCNRTPSRLSRYAKLEPFLEQLPLERAVIFACSDDWVQAVAELDDNLAQRFTTSQASKTALEVCLNKGKFAETLRRLDLPHPRTNLLKTEEDLTALADSDIADSFLKPCDSQAFSAQYHVKAFNISSRDDALLRFRQVKQAGLEVMLQERIPGPPTNHYFIDGFVDRKGRVCARFARRRIRMYPPDFGNSSYMTTVPLEEVFPAVQALARLIETIEYRGIFAAEFKYDHRDNTFKILEMNVRPWWYIEFAALCGVDVCRMAYQDALGEEVQPVETYDVGANYVYAAGDLSTAIHLIRRGELSVNSWLNSWLNAKQAVFQWDDPLPAGIEFVSWVRDKLAELFSARRSG